MNEIEWFAEAFGISEEEAVASLTRIVAAFRSPVTGGRYLVYPDGRVIRIWGRKPLLHKGKKGRKW